MTSAYQRFAAALKRLLTPGPSVNELLERRQADRQIHAGVAEYHSTVIAKLRADLAAAQTAKDGAYRERNQVVAALAQCFPSGIARTAIDGWSEDWHGCVYIDLPTGQASWHFHDSEADLFAALPPYTGGWDQHDTAEKYRRLAELRTITIVPGYTSIGAVDVLAERERQIEVEGYTPRHDDDEHDLGELAAAAAAYALVAADHLHPLSQGDGGKKPPQAWPWGASWWKPTTPRRDLVKSSALAMAAVDQLDRQAAKAAAARPA